jgi:hypothetical protein
MEALQKNEMFGVQENRRIVEKIVLSRSRIFFETESCETSQSRKTLDRIGITKTFIESRRCATGLLI